MCASVDLLCNLHSAFANFYAAGGVWDDIRWAEWRLLCILGGRKGGVEWGASDTRSTSPFSHSSRHHRGCKKKNTGASLGTVMSSEESGRGVFLLRAVFLASYACFCWFFALLLFNTDRTARFLLSYFNSLGLEYKCAASFVFFFIAIHSTDSSQESRRVSIQSLVCNHVIPPPPSLFP